MINPESRRSKPLLPPEREESTWPSIPIIITPIPQTEPARRRRWDQPPAEPVEPNFVPGEVEELPDEERELVPVHR